MGQTPGSVDIFSTKIWRTALLSCHYHRPRIEKLTWSSVFECLQHTGHLLSVSEVSREVLMLFCAIVIHFNGHSSHLTQFPLRVKLQSFHRHLSATQGNTGAKDWRCRITLRPWTCICSVFYIFAKLKDEVSLSASHFHSHSVWNSWM